MKYIFTLLLMFGSLGSLFGQHYFSHPMYLKNRYALNPAAAGLDNRWELGAQAGTLLQGAEQPPEQAQLQINGPTSETTGMGLQMKSFQAGAFQNFVGQLSGSYQARFSKTSFLSIGISAGMARRTLGSLNLTEQVDLLDETLGDDFYDRTAFRLESGVIYQLNNLHVSVTFPQLYESRIELNSSFVGVLAYDFSFGDITLTPSILHSQFDNEPSLTDINAMVDWRNTAWAQVGYRDNESFNIGVGVNVKDLGFGYTFNQPTGGLGDISSGGHEVLVTMKLGEKSPNSRRAFWTKAPDDEGKEEESEGENEDIASVGKPTGEGAEDIEGLKQDVREMKTMIRKLAEQEEAKKGQPVSMVNIRANGTDGKEMAQGYYVVVHFCETISCARQLQNVYEQAGKIRLNVMKNRSTGEYLLYSTFTEDEKTAQNGKSDLQTKGYLDAKVIEYRKP